MKQVSVLMILFFAFILNACNDADKTQIKNIDNDTIVVIKDSVDLKVDTSLQNH